MCGIMQIEGSTLKECITYIVKTLQTASTGLPVFVAVAIKGLVSHRINECFTTELHKSKTLVAFMKQISRNIKKYISIFIVRRYV